MLTQREIKQGYQFYLERAACYLHKYNEHNENYSFYCGAAHGIGTVLGYEYEQIKKDIAAAIEQAKDEAWEAEAIEAIEAIRKEML